MEYASTSNEFNYEASVAVSQQIAKLQSLVAKMESHGDVVMADPEFRAGIARIARALGTDPFDLDIKPPDAQERKNRISVAVVEVCRGLQAQSGGSLMVTQLVRKISRYLSTQITSREVLAAIKDLAVLGPGIMLETLPSGAQVVRTAAAELSSDQSGVLAACDALGYVTIELLQDNMNWDLQRAHSVLDDMVGAGLLWVDLQCEPAQYWTPSAI